MILTLFIVSGLLVLFGIYSFWKKKGIVGLFSLLAGLLGLALALAVVWFYPEKFLRHQTFTSGSLTDSCPLRAQ